jgi:RNA polymerase sigma-70 factor (ECF subfamily)
MGESDRAAPFVTVSGSSVAADWDQRLRAAAGGDSQAFAAFYDESSPLVYALLLRILRNPADAEEVTLDVYAHIWRKASDYDPSRGSVKSWLVMLARSRAIDRLRSKARSAGEEPLTSIMEVPSGGADPESSSFMSEQRKLILRALQALSPEQRQAIELAYFGGLSQSELAARLQQPLGTVKTRIRLGMMKLREELAGAT